MENFIIRCADGCFMTFHLWSQHVFHYSHYHINLDDVDWSRNSHHITHHHHPHSSYANQQHTKNHNIFHHNDCVSSLQFLVSISFHYTVVIIYLTKRPLCRSYTRTDYYRMKNAINADITIPFIYSLFPLLLLLLLPKPNVSLSL